METFQYNFWSEIGLSTVSFATTDIYVVTFTFNILTLEHVVHIGTSFEAKATHVRSFSFSRRYMCFVEHSLLWYLKRVSVIVKSQSICVGKTLWDNLRYITEATKINL